MENLEITKDNFHCKSCGFCCQLDVVLDSNDILEIKKVCNEIFFLHKDDSDILIRNGDHCMFYNKQNLKCNIYESRPGVCRRFPFKNPIMSARCSQDIQFFSRVERRILEMVEMERNKKKSS